MFKKCIACLLALAMIFGLAACGMVPAGTGGSTAAPAEETEKEAEPAAEEEAEPAEAGEISHDEEYDVEMFNTYANYMGDMEGWFGKILKDRLNMKINIIAPNVAGTGDQLYQTRSAAGNLGDIIVQPKARMIDCYNAGLLGSMSPYLPNCPNLQKLEFAYETFR